MEFKKWFLFKEMSHVQIEPGIEINGKKVAFLDMRFEKYPEMFRGNLREIMHDFSAKIPDSNMFLNYSSARTSVGHKPESKNILPDFWWDYATAIYEDETVKEPTKGI